MKPGRHGERAQTLPIVAMALLLLFGFAALAVDAGYLEYKQRIQQTAADAGSIAGAYALWNGTNVQTAAQASTVTNGFTDNGSTVRVTATSPPATGPNAGNTNAVEVYVTAKYPAIFSAIWGSQNPVSTRAVAVVRDNPNGPCVWAMSKDFTNNSGTISAPCGVIVARDAHIGTANVPSIEAGGKVDGTPSSGTVVSQGVSTPLLDPCTNFVPGCKALLSAFPLGATPGKGPYPSCSTTAPASGSSISGGCYPSMSGTLNLAPGLYVVQGDLSATLTCTLCIPGKRGSGVTIVIGGKVNLNGTTSVLNSPPNSEGVGASTVTTDGAPGVLLYQTSTNTNPENFSAQSLLGMIYAPNAHINLDGGGSTLTTTFVVGADIVANKATISVQNTAEGSPLQAPVLSE